MGELTMISKLAQKEDEWQAKATAAAIASARKIVAINGGSFPATVLLGKLSDQQWGWIVTAAIFGWIETRCAQAIAEGLDQEVAVRLTGLNPSPCDVAAVNSILPLLADKAGIDWKLPLSAWSKNDMTNFLLMAVRLIDAAAEARDSGKIVRQPELDEKTGDPIPF
jgi:hypothetical protein